MFFAIKRLYKGCFGSRRNNVVGTGCVWPGCIGGYGITTTTTTTTTTTSVIATLLIFNSLLSVGDACSSRSTPKPKPPPPVVVGSTARPNITFHTYACPPMHASWYCLNGATCFTVKIGEHTLYNCECAEGYMGPRCEFKDLDSSYLLSRKQVLLETASIAFGATLAILLVVIVCASLYIRYSRLQKQRRESSVTSCVDSGGVSRKPFSRRVQLASPLPLVDHYLSKSSTSSSSVSSFHAAQQSSFAMPSSSPSCAAPTTASACCCCCCLSEGDGRERRTIDSNYFLFSPDIDVEIGRNMTKNNDGNPARHHCAFHHHHGEYCYTDQNHYLLMQKEASTNKNQTYNTKIDSDKIINTDEGTKFTNTANSYDKTVHFQHEADDWCSETVPSLCLRIMKKIEALLTFELPLKRIFENLIKVLITNDQDDDDDDDDDKQRSKIQEQRRLFRRADIVGLYGQPMITLLSEDHHHRHRHEQHDGSSLIHHSTAVGGPFNGATTAYKILTLVPAVCIPIQTDNVLLVDVKLDQLASKQFSYV